jgi:hypothetical protein
LKIAAELCLGSVYYTRGEVSVSLRRFAEFMNMKQGAEKTRKE